MVSTDQLTGLDFTRHEVRHLVEAAHLHRLHRGVYAVGRRSISRRGWLFAALLACGDTSFLSHRTAIGVRGLCKINPYAIHVSVLGTGTRRRSGLIIHRLNVSPHPGEVTVTGGLRASSVYRALVEMAVDESKESLGEIIELGVRRGVLKMAKLEETLSVHAGANGLRNLKAVLAAYRPRPFDKSGLERAVALAIAADPSMPPPLRNVHQHAGGINWELDFFWPEARVALETDGSQYHLTPQDRERDRIKDAKLMADGITPVRITDVRWELDPAGALQDLKAILKRRQAPGVELNRR